MIVRQMSRTPNQGPTHSAQEPPYSEDDPGSMNKSAAFADRLDTPFHGQASVGDTSHRKSVRLNEIMHHEGSEPDTYMLTRCCHRLIKQRRADVASESFIELLEKVLNVTPFFFVRTYVASWALSELPANTFAGKAVGPPHSPLTG